MKTWATTIFQQSNQLLLKIIPQAQNTNEIQYVRTLRRPMISSLKMANKIHIRQIRFYIHALNSWGQKCIDFAERCSGVFVRTSS